MAEQGRLRPYLAQDRRPMALDRVKEAGSGTLFVKLISTRTFRGSPPIFHLRGLTDQVSYGSIWASRVDRNVDEYISRTACANVGAWILFVSMMAGRTILGSLHLKFHYANSMW